MMDAVMIDALIDKAATALGGGTIVTLAAYVLHKIKRFPFKVIWGDKEPTMERRKASCITKRDLDAHCKVIHDKANIVQAHEARILGEISVNQRSMLGEMVEIKDRLTEKLYNHEGRIGEMEGQLRRVA